MVSSPAKREEIRRMSQAPNVDNEMLGKHDDMVMEVRRRSSSSGGVMATLAHTASEHDGAAAGAAPQPATEDAAPGQ